MKQLPNATTVLVLGILSIVTCFCYGLIGIILGTIALIIAKNDLKLYRENPENYEGYSNLNTGRICAIIGVSIGSVILIVVIVYLSFLASVMIPIFQTAAASAH